MTRRHSYAHDTEKVCRARGSHNDADLLIQYLMARGGHTDETAEAIAQALGWVRRLGSARVTDRQRFELARNHIKDGITKSGDPCLGFRIHYRTSAKGDEWMLVDPSGGIAHHRQVARAEILGDIQQQVSFRTVNGRRIATAHSMADYCLAATPPDTHGYQLMTEYAMEIERFGAVSDVTIAKLMAYFA